MLDDKIPMSSIINIASIIGKTGNVGQCNYAASKAGVEAFTRSVSKELAKLVLYYFIDSLKPLVMLNFSLKGTT